MRDLVAADCGGANALTKLTRHFAKDESRRLIDQGASRGQLQNGRILVIVECFDTDTILVLDEC